MPRFFTLVVLLSCLSAQRVSAQAARNPAPLTVNLDAPQAEPPTGRPGFIIGGIALGVAALNLALLPVCQADFYRRAIETCAWRPLQPTWGSAPS